MTRTRKPKVRKMYHRQSAAEEQPQQGQEAPAQAKKSEEDTREIEEEHVVLSRKPITKSKVAFAKRAACKLENNLDKKMKEFEEFEKKHPPSFCEANLEFCCAVCRCSNKQDPNQNPDNADYPYLFEDRSEEGWPHRMCCHKAFLFSEQDEFATLYNAAATKIADAYEDAAVEDSSTGLQEEFRSEPTPLEWVTFDGIHSAYATAKSQESALYNADGEGHTLDILRTNDGYSPMIEQPFLDLSRKVSKIDNNSRRKAVVLEVFAGVGTGSVVLKRLGIAIKKVILIEFDQIAAHVYKSNHDTNYNRKLPCDHAIEHVYDYKRWEDFVNTDMDEFLEKHGPIDIIIGGPPCVDYSMVNARRKGSKGQQGQYMIEFGRTIRVLERLQSNMHKQPLFFLAENVWMQGDDLSEVNDAFGFEWDPVVLDALYLSPTRRKRHFFTNVPLADLDYSGVMSEVGPTSCLEPGFCVAGHIVEPDATAKAQCLMASTSRIDERNSLRMYVFQNEKNPKTGNYHGRPLQVCEREKLMGYNKGYVETPVRQLFKTLVENGLSQQRRSEGSWRKKLDKKYHCFAGNYHSLPVHNAHRFEVVKDRLQDGTYMPRFQPELMMAPPMNSDTSTPSFFNAEDYAKHLIGNAFSVPVVEHLLTPLQQIFQAHRYTGYDYEYAWMDEVKERLLQRENEEKEKCEAQEESEEGQVED